MALLDNNHVESSAVCISDMLLHVSNGAYLESICLSERFLVHVEALFAGIDKINVAYQEYKQPGKEEKTTARPYHLTVFYRI